MAFEIQKGIPLPKINRGTNGGRKWKYPLLEMEVGDSFFAPDTRPSVGSARKHGIKVTVRRVTEDGVDGWRVWRVG